MQLYPGAYQISSIYKDGRFLFQYLLVGERVLLVDSGIAETPGNSIFPYMDKLDLNPERLTMVITTHPDLDHQGGNSAIRESAPGAILACGEADRHLVEDPGCLFRERYNFLRDEHRVGMGDEIPSDAAAVVGWTSVSVEESGSPSTMAGIWRCFMSRDTRTATWPCTMRPIRPHSSAMPAMDAAAPKRTAAWEFP